MLLQPSTAGQSYRSPQAVSVPCPHTHTHTHPALHSYTKSSTESHQLLTDMEAEHHIKETPELLLESAHHLRNDRVVSFLFSL